MQVELCLGTFALGDVLDMADVVERYAVSVAHEGNVDYYPDWLTVFLDVAFFKFELFDLMFHPTKQALFEAYILLQVVLSRTRFPWTQNWLNRSVQGGPEHDR